METKDHFLIRFVEERVPACPYCQRKGKYAKLVWDLHPEDSRKQNIQDRVFGNCRNGHDIFIGVNAVAWKLGEDKSFGERVDCWGGFEKDG